MMGIFDPTGMLSPITVKLKLELRKLFKLENASLGWDDPIPKENPAAWEALVTELILLPIVMVPRSVKPQDSVGQPEFFTFFADLLTHTPHVFMFAGNLTAWAMTNLSD